MERRTTEGWGIRPRILLVLGDENLHARRNAPGVHLINAITMGLISLDDFKSPPNT